MNVRIKRRLGVGESKLGLGASAVPLIGIRHHTHCISNKLYSSVLPHPRGSCGGLSSISRAAGDLKQP
jgi:hypothetical protein